VTTTSSLTPVEAQLGDIIGALEAVALRENADFTAGELIALLGASSHILVILVFSVLNMIPGPPGYGGTMALAIMAFSVAMIAGAPLRLPSWIGERRLPVKTMLGVVTRLATLARIIGRFSRPRLLMLTMPAMRPLLGLFIIAVSAPMIVPIPFINAVPNVGICVLCLGWINRDGLGVIAGALIGFLGFVIACLAIWGVYELVNAAIGAAA